MPVFFKVLEKLGCVSSLPPSDAVRPLAEGLFHRHAPSGELHYKTFAVEVLRLHGVRVPAAEADAREAQALANGWQVATSVQQALARRNLEPSQPHRSRADRANQMHADLLPRGAWEDPTIAARAAEEGAAYRIARLHDVIDGGPAAALRGRLAGGAKGRQEATRIREEQDLRRDQRRAEAEEYAKQGRANVLRAWEDHQLNAKQMWEKKRQEVDRLGGLAPGEAMALAARRRAM